MLRIIKNIKKVAVESKEKTCNSFQHKPASMIFLPEGSYEHTCTSCGERIAFNVPPMPTLQ